MEGERKKGYERGREEGRGVNIELEMTNIVTA